MKLKICLPLVIALVVVLGTVGIVLGATVINRTINVTIIDSVVISPSEDESITVYKGEYIDVVYQISNPSNTAYNVSCSWDTPPTGITVTATPTNVYIPPKGNDSISVRVAADETASNASIYLHFTATAA